ncbi:MAG: hypothetical protein PVF66_12995 [Candidatus Aminicenantes bacterium]
MNKALNRTVSGGLGVQCIEQKSDYLSLDNVPHNICHGKEALKKNPLCVSRYLSDGALRRQLSLWYIQAIFSG